MILLDSDIAVDLFRQFPPAVFWLANHAGDEFCLPGLVVMELIQGCANKRDMIKVQKFVEPFPLRWLSPDDSNRAVAIYASGKLTHALGLIDALIGQLALSLDVPLHTFNQKHFAAIPNLKTIQPYNR